MDTSLAALDEAQTETASLAELESVIERGQQTFIEVGLALRAIQERRLYREQGYDTFESYIRERWGWTRQHGYELMWGAQVAENVSLNVHSLPSLSQAVQLASLPPDEQREIAATVDFSQTTVRELKAIAQERKAPSAAEAEPEDDAVDAEIREVEPPTGEPTYREVLTNLLHEHHEQLAKLENQLTAATILDAVTVVGASELVRQVQGATLCLVGAVRALKDVKAKATHKEKIM